MKFFNENPKNPYKAFRSTVGVIKDPFVFSLAEEEFINVGNLNLGCFVQGNGKL